MLKWPVSEESSIFCFSWPNEEMSARNRKRGHQSSPPSLAGGTPLFVEALEDMADVRRDMLNSKKYREKEGGGSRFDLLLRLKVERN